MNEPLQEALAEAVSFLEQHEVPYVLVGGLAASIHGELRATADVDLVIQVDVDEAISLLASLPTSMFQPLFAGVEEFIQTAFILPLRHVDTGVKVDLALGMSGFEKQMISRARPIVIGAKSVNSASPEDLLVMKLLAGRPRDQQDAEGIALAQGSQLDWTFCTEVAIQLGQAVDQDLASQVQRLQREYGTPD